MGSVQSSWGYLYRNSDHRPQRGRRDQPSAGVDRHHVVRRHSGSLGTHGHGSAVAVAAVAIAGARSRSDGRLGHHS